MDKNDPEKAKALQDEAKALKAKAKEAEPVAKEASKKLKGLKKKLGGKDADLAKLIMGEKVNAPRPPYPGQYLGCRYQDDSTNPTNYGNRRQVNGPFPPSDMFTTDQPFGGAHQAAIGYIYTDYDAWPGWHSGWSPGNPNFHTDKYIASVFAGAAMPDHPHAKEWIQFGEKNFQADLKKVMLAPDGVGYECPGYSGFSVGLQIETAQAFLNSGLGNPIATYPLFKGNALWHRYLITPYDKRIGKRHEAPHGDTHRWDSGMGASFATLARFYTEADPAFASELMGTFKFLKDSGASLKHKGLFAELAETDLSIKPMDPKKMDWTSRHFYGFGSIMRNRFDTDEESFLSFRAGPTGGHYHNDQLAYHFYSGGTPISLDYNCSYHPRGDHGCLHNTSTFGKPGKIKNNTTGKMVDAMEQAYGTAYVGAFVGSKIADVTVAERVTSGVSMTPIDPHDAEFQRQYPHRKTGELVHRRFMTFVKHEAGSPFEDYIVVRDEFDNDSEKQQINIHLLARDAKVDGNMVKLNGQWDKDMIVYFADATDLNVETRGWGYYDGWMVGPGEQYEYKPGETTEQWTQRMKALKAKQGRIPHEGWKPEWKGGKPEEVVKHWGDLLHESHGKSMMPPPLWEESWLYGEYQVWLRCETKPGTPALWVLYPYKRGTTPPTFEQIDGGTGVKLTLDGKSEQIIMSTAKGVQVTADGQSETLLKPGDLPALGEIKRKPPTLNRPMK